jgi:hypothetical protein
LLRSIIPPYPLQVVVDGFGSNIATFSSPVPSWDALINQGTWTAMSTLGGQSIFINGVTDVGALDPSEISILVGPYVCTNLTKKNQVRAH